MSPHPDPPARGMPKGDELLILAARLVRSQQDEVLAPLGLTLAAVMALKGIAAQQIAQEQLAAKLHVRTQTLGRILARLETAGLLTRTRNPMDRRQRMLKLTPTGEEVLKAARQSETTLTGGVDTENWAALQDELIKFVAFLEAHPPRAEGP